jgi:hypothetical protein
MAVIGIRLDLEGTIPYRQEMGPPRQVGQDRRGDLHTTMPRRGVSIEVAPEKGATNANNLCHEGEFTNQSFEFGKMHGLPGKEIPKDVQNRSNPFGRGQNCHGHKIQDQTKELD